MECNASLFQVPNIISNYVNMYFVSVYTLSIFNNFNTDLGNSFTAMIIALPWIPRSRRRAWDSWKTMDHSWKMSIQIESTYAIAIRIKPLHIYRVICRLAPSKHLLSWREQQSPAATKVLLASSPRLKCLKLYILLFIWCWVISAMLDSLSWIKITDCLSAQLFHLSHLSQFISLSIFIHIFIDIQMFLSNRATINR